MNSKEVLLAEIGHRITAAMPNLGCVLETTAEELGRVMGAGCVLFLESEQDPGLLEPLCSWHEDADYMEFIRAELAGAPLRLGEGLTGKVAQSGESLVIPEVTPEQLARMVDPRHLPIVEARPVRSMMVVALPSLSGPIGALTLFFPEVKGPANTGDLRFVERLASCAGLVISNTQTFERLQAELAHREQAEAERLELERRIQHAQKLESLGVLAGGIAHDFNNLLVGILGNASLALLDLPPESPARESVHQIELTARRASELTHQLLAYSGKGRFVVTRIDLSRLVEEITHLLEVTISKKAVLKFDFASVVLPVEADATQMRQVVMNLITNASDAVGETSGIITIATGMTEADERYLSGSWLPEPVPPGTYTYLEVSDTGQGMSPAALARIFEPFYSTKGSGRGLGLAAVLGIVRGHNGALKVYSEPGRGTTIKVLLPCAEPAELLPGSPGEVLPVPADGSTVLLADDEETVRSVGRRVLERAGYRVMTASDGKEAVEIFEARADDIDLVLLDMTMPRLSGAEAYARIRSIRPEVPTLLSSGYNEQDATSRFAGKGLAGFLQKPWTAQSLVEAVERVLRSNGEAER